MLLTSYQTSSYSIVSWKLKEQEVIRHLQDPLSLWEGIVQKEVYLQREFPGGPVVRTPAFTAKGVGPASRAAKKKKKKTLKKKEIYLQKL